jgi:hypothetical protein
MTELYSDSKLHLFDYLKIFVLIDSTGISFVNPTPFRECFNRRITQHKTFKNIVQSGLCSLGWFYGFTLHFFRNDKGELVDMAVTPGNFIDRKPLSQK